MLATGDSSRLPKTPQYSGQIFLLAELMDEVMRAGAKFVIVFIDFVSAFDTVSHHFLDEAMAAVEEELIAQGRGSEILKLRKCRAMFRAI